MKKIFALLAMTAFGLTATAQLKPRPDAFPPVEETFETKAINMATTIEGMANWDRYPTYPVYLEMMQRWAEDYPTLCHIDTIGTSVQGRLILSLYIETPNNNELYRPEFFYSSTIHGDEVTGYVMMLHLIDTLLSGYGTNEQYTNLLNHTRISINPLANPDGTYWRGNNDIRNAVRNNANNVDLNRNYPNPFGGATKGSNPKGTKDAVEPENAAMIAYFMAHNFKLSANLHGGAEVMNYPWDSFLSRENPHPAKEWWEAVCHRFVDTSRTYNADHFNDTYASGVTAGGDWYIIEGGRQDYVNFYHNCLELTMELSTDKTLSSERLPEYWSFLQHSLVNYIAEIHSLPDVTGIERPQPTSTKNLLKVYPNPTTGKARVENGEQETITIDLSGYPAGVYYIRIGNKIARVIKN